MTDRIEKAIELKASLERVWRALTDADQFGEWFCVKLDGPFVLGEEVVGHILYPGFEHLDWRARVTAIELMTRFVFTWHPYAIDPNVDYSQEPPTTVEFRLEPTADGVRVTVVESGFDALPPHRREEALPRNERGWTTQAKNIRDYVER